MGYNEFPWIKFTILCVPLIVLMINFAPTLKWKILFSLCVPIGVGLALKGKSFGKSHSAGGF